MENKLIKISIWLAILLVGLTNNAQGMLETGLINYKKSTYYNTNYNGPIKSSLWYYTYLNEDFIQNQTHRNKQGIKEDIMANNLDILGWEVFKRFDKDGTLINTVRLYEEKSYLGKTNLNMKTSANYEYDKYNQIEENEYKITKKQKYPIWDHELLMKLNYCSLPGNSSHIHNIEYEYLRDKKGRIIAENKYRFIKIGYSINESIDSVFLERLQADQSKIDSVPYTQSEFIYNKIGNIIRVNIQTKKEHPVPFHFLGTETRFCPDLHVAYEYNSNNLITQVTYIGCNDTLAFEKYDYEPEKGYVSKRTRFIDSGRRTFTHLSSTMIYYHNENGDIIQKQYTTSRPDLPVNISAGYTRLPESIYYTYEYDEYNN